MRFISLTGLRFLDSADASVCRFILVAAASYASECPGLVLNRWYLDDGVLMGNTDDVAKALEIIGAQGPGLGLFLNMKKTQFYTMGGSKEDLRYRYSMAADTYFVTLEEEGGFLLLGSPIGTLAFCSEHFKDKVIGDLTAISEKLREVDCTQTVMYILRSCYIFCKACSLVRTVPADLIHTVVVEYDNEMAGVVEQALALPVADDVTRRQAGRQMSLSCRRGGLGVRRVARHADAAYLASVAAVAKLEGREPAEYHSYGAARSRIEAAVRAEYTGQSQRQLSEALETIDFVTLQEDADSKSKARLLSASQKGSASFVSACPNPIHGLLMRPEVYTAAVSFLLGIERPSPLNCRVCNQPFQGSPSYHATTCRASISLRHSAICRTIVDLARMGRLRTQTEVDVLGGGRREADILLTCGQQTHVVDVAITHPAQPKFMPTSGAKPAHAANEYARTEKMEKLIGREGGDVELKTAIQAVGHQCTPGVMETFGACSDSMHKLLGILARAIKGGSMIPIAVATNLVRQRISVALYTENAKMISNSDDTVGIAFEDLSVAPLAVVPDPSRASSY